jgi:uncharacterized protein (DUF2141 family)
VTNPANGCTNTAQAIVTENVATPNASATGGNLTCTTTCLNVVASSTTPGATFQWTGGPATASWQRCAPGTYTVTVTNPANGCTSTATATVTQNITAPNASATGGMIPCNATCINVVASSTTPGATFQWTGGPATASWQVCAAGTYTVTVTNPANGCTSTATATVTLETPCDCQLRTQTQGGWGAVPQGNNPGVYLHAHFAQAFPNGVTIGGSCAEGRRLRLTTAQAVTNFLPSGGQPAMLPPGVLTNPVNYNNTFAGQLVALTLSVGFDAANPNFGQSNTLLGNTWVVSGLFSGMQVSQILQLANNKIGNCGGTYSVSALNGILSTINENFVDGTIDNGNLSCVKKDGGKMMQTEEDASDAMIAFPNPATDKLTVRTTFVGEGAVTIDLMDLSGRVIRAMEQFDAKAGELRISEIDVNDLQPGIYLLMVTRGGHSMSERIVIAE